MIKKAILFSFIIFICVPQLTAQGLRIGPQVGYHKAKDAEEGKYLFGAVLRLNLSSSLTVEGSINYRQEKFSGDTLTVKSWPIMVTGLYRPLPFIYGAVGAGWYNTTFDFDQNLLQADDETNQEFGWHFGAGLEIPVGSKTRVTGDVRYVFLDYNFKNIPFDDVDSNFYVITVGILFGL